MPLDEDIDSGQAGHIADHEAIHALVNDAETTAWVEPSVGTGWTIQGSPYEIPRYRKWMGFVTMQGLVLNNSGGALGPLDVIFTLPTGYRPRAIVNAVPFSAAGMEIAPTGEVRVNNSIPNSTFLSLTISFVPGA